MISGNSVAACLIRPMILSMIVAKIAVGRIEGPMILIVREPRVLALLSGQTQSDIKVTKVVGKRTGRNQKAQSLLKKSAVGRGARQEMPNHEASVRFPLNGLERIKRLLSPPRTGILS